MSRITFPSFPTRLVLPLLVAGLLLALPPAPASALGLEGWGPRLGVGDDPDQAILGWHIDFGEVAPRLHLRPGVEIGLGDDHTIASLTVPVEYRFRVASQVVPYVGAGVRLALIDRDLPRRSRDDDQELDLAPMALGGIAWALAGGSDMFLELELAGGDAHDARLLLGWRWRP